jgi:hypothetical protein
MPTQTGGKNRYRSNPFANRHQKEVRDQHHVPAALPLLKTGTLFTRGWVGLGTSLDGREILTPHRDSIPGPSIS